MILTQCAVCATELGLSLGKKCGRCSTRYCGPECQKQHWEQGGHDQLCKKIKKSGGAEQYNANKKYTEAVAAAAETCAEDTKGQTCYICTQALHWKTREGLVRMCACRGTAGFAHVSCLAEQAKILVAEAEENNLDMGSRWARWYLCSLCEQHYHGVVYCALSWACWKTYVARPEADMARINAMTQLGNGLQDATNYEDAFFVREAALCMLRRLGASENLILGAQSNLANSCEKLGQVEQALSLQRYVYFGDLKLYGEENERTLIAANNYASSLNDLQRFEEVKSLLRRTVPVAQRVLRDSDELMLKLGWTYAEALYKDDSATLADLREAVTTLEDAERTARRVLGCAHPSTSELEKSLRKSRVVLAASEAQSLGDLCEALEAI